MRNFKGYLILGLSFGQAIHSQSFIFDKKAFQLISLSHFSPCKPLNSFRYVRTIFQMTAYVASVLDRFTTPHGQSLTSFSFTHSHKVWEWGGHSARQRPDPPPTKAFSTSPLPFFTRSGRRASGSPQPHIQSALLSPFRQAWNSGKSLIE